MRSSDDRYVLMRTYPDQSEAHMAKHMLEEEGISVILEDVETSNTFGVPALEGARARLLVLEDDAARATALLADVESRIELADDWEDQAEGGYVCQTCDEPVPDGFSACPACSTPCESIRTNLPQVSAPRSRPRAADDGVKAPEPAGGVTSRPREVEAPVIGDRRPGCLGLLLAAFVFWW
jgi:hypothetical protein